FFDPAHQGRARVLRIGERYEVTVLVLGVLVDVGAGLDARDDAAALRARAGIDRRDGAGVVVVDLRLGLEARDVRLVLRLGDGRRGLGRRLRRRGGRVRLRLRGSGLGGRVRVVAALLGAACEDEEARQETREERELSHAPSCLSSFGAPLPYELV